MVTHSPTPHAPTNTHTSHTSYTPSVLLPISLSLSLSLSPHTYTHTLCTLTGRPGWGIAWFINGTIIPELVVERGRTYTFLVYGGANPIDGSNYHPFYITNSPSGGRLLNTPEQRAVSQYTVAINRNFTGLLLIAVVRVVRHVHILCRVNQCLLDLTARTMRLLVCY